MGVPEDLFSSIVEAPDRDRAPDAPAVVSVRDDDEPEYLAAVESRLRRRVELERRGVQHGAWAVLRGSPPAQDAAPHAALLAQRWHTARPIFVPAAGDPRVEWGEEIGARRALHDDLKEPGGLRAFLKSRREELAPCFALQGPSAGQLADPERDIERVGLSWALDPDAAHTPRVRDLWAKSGWLSNRDDDESLRLRLSFGHEGADDASRDPRKHKRVTELARALLPEAAVASEDRRVSELLERELGCAPHFTQHIAYWNGPGGGALFHHDAFDEDALGGQRGVCFVQLSGATAWLALSIEDLTRRVIEFAEILADGELEWVRAQAFRKPEQFERLLKMTKRFKRVERELSRPGQGFLGRIVNRGPEFTSLLADAGHAYVLEPGDILLLPNHGLERTAMHSVFCASDEPAYGISMAIREAAAFA